MFSSKYLPLQCNNCLIDKHNFVCL
uniref:Uncharacterized protein n=1 Tax=Anopheles minimus TaxID=112268 RepID=A0A182WNT5_9DIPT